MQIYIDEKGFLKSFSKYPGCQAVEVSEEVYKQLHTCKIYHQWALVNNEWVMINVDELPYLRKRRERECFDIVNRGNLWYDTLSEEQREQLKNWYKAWLDVTDTKTIPEPPQWLK